MLGYRSVYITVFLAVIGMIVFLNYKDADNGLTFYIAYLALIYSIMSSTQKYYKTRKRVRVIHISGSCAMDLSLNLSRRLKEIEEKRLLVRDVQVISDQSAIIMYVR